jgi:uncharacterized membrane protein
MNYFYYKLIHVFAVVIFLGNIITGLYWMQIAVKTKELQIISHTMKGIIKADRYFTIPGIIIITTFGIMAAISAHFPIFHTGWIVWSIILFSISGIVFSIKVAPLQRKIYNLTSNKNGSPDFDWKNFDKIYLQWDVWGLIALATPLLAFLMMILKIPQ